MSSFANTFFKVLLVFGLAGIIIFIILAEISSVHVGLLTFSLVALISCLVAKVVKVIKEK